ncbi:MAG: hypothetical protein JW768_08855 [Chitinispirillaceae bacterium]|nr:hypothetical protein [Chitinispirillaceae bacterium]
MIRAATARCRMPVVGLGAALLVAGCAVPAHRLMPGYEKMDVREAACGVILVGKNVSIPDQQLVAGVLGGGDAVQRYYYFFGDTFPELMARRSGFRSVTFLPGADQNMRNRADGLAEMDEGGGLLVPAQRHYVDAGLAYLLIVDYCSVKREGNTGVPMLGSEGDFTGFTTGLDFAKQSATFVLWDNRTATIAAYGRIEEKIPTGGDITTTTLVELLRQTAASISRGMPYRK